MPLKENCPLIEENLGKLCNRLWKLKERLDKEPEHLKHYNDIIQNQLNKGVVKVVDKEPSGEKCFEGGMTYLPHHEVTREDKSSTKLWIVYDASSNGKNGVSLNDCLYKGQYMTPMLYDLKFRTHPIAITADIEKVYLQISLKERHRNLLRFL